MSELGFDIFEIIDRFSPGVWSMLWVLRDIVFKLEEGSSDIVIHGDVIIAFLIVTVDF